ncbi:hypothetical protein MKX08_002998 [Trichoderma sp. CBMAI-0020]|nr:hypothetical protein MKX08_002998 [Trichoderma sp. CBMAI-0020]
MSNPHDYTVGWICAIPTEYVAAQAFLDEKHKGPDYLSPNDNNDYTLGKIGRHNIAIAVLPNGEYGLSSAACVARDMLHSFPNIRIGLMVGISGGAPSSKHDIRLGDIVVGVSNNGKNGVVQYDFGKAIQGQEFQETGFLNQPPTLLRTAVSGLRAQYETDGNQIKETVNSALAKKPRLRKKYKRPEAITDRLYRSQVVHPLNSETDCAVVCGDDPSSLIERRERDEDDDDPMIHYGLIASANTLMKDASVRDELIARKGVLCFEMEAAGLINHFPCLIIRGVCDYSDSHKNKEWQGYAAMTAAAYAKDLLLRIAPNKVEAEKKIGDILSGLHEVAKEHRDIAKEQLESQKDLAKERLSEKEQECHQLFRLTSNSKDTTYEWYKDRVEERVKDTCLWFLKHEHYQKWLEQESGPLLVTADPGCGKSVLAKYLINYGLPQSATICYFFFKDQDQNTSRQALCALLHQLFSQKPCLIQHAMPQFRTDGQGLINSTESLWKILRGALKDPKAGPIIIVLDALDECDKSEFADLTRNIESQFHSDYLSPGKLKYLLTCRPYEQITSKFHGLLKKFPNIRIPGEEESDSISQEVNRVITHRIKQLSEKKNFSTEIKSHLEKKLQETTHRTYLWVYLVFNYLEENVFKKTKKEIDSIITTLPKSVNEAYEQILNKPKEDLAASVVPVVRKALSIILAASRPLTLSEMNIAMNTDNTAQDGTTQTFHDLDLENESDFKSRLRSWCGLFISIYHGKVYFLHQTAREFLLADVTSPTAISSELHWYHSITTREAHTILAELCVLYLNFFNSDVNPTIEANEKSSCSTNGSAFLHYSAENWGAHFREACVTDDAAIVPFAMRICNPNSQSYLAWFKIYWETTHMETTGNFTDLLVASYFGHYAVVKLCLKTAAEIDSKDSEFRRTPLLWASENGHEAVVKLLLEKGADIEAKGKDGWTPLLQAAEHGHEAVFKLLLDWGANIEARDSGGETPLVWAAEGGYEAIVKLLLEKGADVEAKAEEGYTSLLWAAERGHEAIVQLLLENGADVNVKSEDGETPLSQAAKHGDEAIVKLLLQKGAEIGAMDVDGRTPLFWADANGHGAVVKLLFEKLLVEKGFNIEEKNDEDTTGYKSTEIEVNNTTWGRTLLWWAAEGGMKL